jgi:peptidoglycan/LPS O-acetylase OafA/YrhL
MSTAKYIQRLYRKDPNLLGHIEGLRALAAFRVMLYHVAVFGVIFFEKKQYLEMLKNSIFKIALATSPLLDTFFVISGLVIGSSLIKEYKDYGKVNLYEFFVRRCARVYPLYLAAIVISFLFFYNNFQNVWANILQVNNILPVQKQYMIWTWSLAVDFQFYVILSLVMWLLSKKFIGKKICYSLALGFFLLPFVITALQISSLHYYHFTNEAFLLSGREFWQYFDMGFDKIYVRSSPILYGVITGYLLVYHQDKLQDILQRVSKGYISLLCIGLLVIMISLLANDPIWFTSDAEVVWQTSTYWVIVIQRAIFALTLCLLLILAHMPKGIIVSGLVRILSLPLLRPFGRLSYTTYIIHPIVIVPGYLIFFLTHPAMTAAVYFQQGLWLIFLTYLLAVPCYLFIEQPAMDYLKEKWLPSKRQADDIKPIEDAETSKL